MNILGGLGSFYMYILVLLIVIGFGITGLWLINLIFAPKAKNTATNSNMQGGYVMNRWLRLSVFSVVGIIISMILIALITPQNMSGGHGDTSSHGGGSQQASTAMAPMNNMSGGSMGMSGMSGGSSGMSMSNMSGGGMGMMNMPMGNMQQGGMSMPMNNMQGMGMNTRPTGNAMVDYVIIMEKLNSMQMQINIMQQQMMNSSMSGGGMSGGGGGGMSMM